MCRSALPLPHFHGAVCQGSEEGPTRFADHVPETGTRHLRSLIVIKRAGVELFLMTGVNYGVSQKVLCS